MDDILVAISGSSYHDLSVLFVVEHFQVCKMAVVRDEDIDSEMAISEVEKRAALFNETAEITEEFICVTSLISKHQSGFPLI